jgi:fructose-specific PTS system IIA-like component
MIVEYRFTLGLPHGLHVRPASRLAAFCAGLEAQITLTNERTGRRADASSVLELVSTGIEPGDPCLLSAEGPAGRVAVAAVERFVVDELVRQEAAPVARPPAGTELPRLLRQAANTPYLPGIGASQGVGIGALVRLQPGSLDPGYSTPALPPEQERARLDSALQAVEAELLEQIEQTESDILRATLAILRDATLRRTIDAALAAGGSAVQAVRQAIREFSGQLGATGSCYLQERIVELEDLGAELLGKLGVPTGQTAPQLTAPTVLVAHTLAARVCFELDRAQLRGLVLTGAGPTSHAVILARSFGIPVVCGVAADHATEPGAAAVAVVDGTRGLFWPQAGAVVEQFYRREQARDTERHARLTGLTRQPAVFKDGKRLEIGANLASAAEVPAALAHGAECVGLFRTELFFAGRSEPPGEEEQFQEYRRTLALLQGRPLVIRTLDVGGDKPLPYLSLPHEDNPFLGQRGVRLYGRLAGLFTAHLRAILRASAHGPVKLMAPMITAPGEVRWLRAQVAAAQAELEAAGAAFDRSLPIGAMLETPAAALSVAALSRYCDFFSLGTNDLCQYVMAAERGNPQVAALCDPLQPAFIRLLHSCIAEAHRQGRWIGICGEMAGQLELLPLVAALGPDEISVAIPQIPALKQTLSRLHSNDMHALLSAAMECETAAEVRLLLGSATQQEGEPVLAEELVGLDSAAEDKAWVLHELAGMLYSTGRTAAPDAVEEALWAREEEFSTSVGHGVAVPHCKTGAVTVPSLAMLRLERPVGWNDAQGDPVDLVLLLALPAAAGAPAHLRIFARLARRLMDAAFRDTLRGADDARTVVRYLSAELELSDHGED